MANKVFTGLTMFACIVAMGITTYAFYAKDWAHFDDGTDDTEFGLWTVTDGSDSAIDMSWDCYKVLWCEISDEFSGATALENSADAWCDQATAFKKAAMIYYCCNLVALVLLAKFLVSLTAIMNEKDPGHKRWMYGCAGGFAVLALAGFGAWWGLTEVAYDADCDDDDYGSDLVDGDRWKMCAGMGATISIIAAGMMAIAGILGIVYTMKLEESAECNLSEDEVPCCGMKIHTMLFANLLWVCIILAMAGIVVR